MTIYKYINNGGDHMTEDLDIVKKGESFESSKPDLHKKFVNKFTLVGDAGDAEIKAAKQKKAPKTAAKKTEDTAPVEVTGEFDAALNADLQVFKHKKGWQVTDEGDPIQKGLLKKGEVDAAIQKYLDETESGDE